MSGKLAKVHLWSDIPGQRRLWVLTPMSTGRTARDHAGKGDLVWQVTCLASFEHILKELRKHDKVDRLDFHTHGNSGIVALGLDLLSYRTLPRFRDKGYEGIFNPEAQIFFHGCNISEGAWGELFLAEFGAIFLKGGGGRVGASTSLGFNSPVGGSTYHFWGETVYAEVKPGGAVDLKNHKHLDRRHIKQKLDELETDILPEIQRIYQGRGDWEANHVLAEASKAAAQLKLARRYFNAAGAGNGRFARLNDADCYAHRAEILLYQAMMWVNTDDRVRARFRELLSKLPSNRLRYDRRQ